MEDADVTESGLDAGAGEAKPEPSTQVDSSTSERDLDALVKALLPAIDEAVERKTQSVKDKGIYKLNQQVAEIGETLAKYDDLLKGGKTPDEAKDYLETKQRLETLEQAMSAPPEELAGKPETPEASVEVQAILKELGLDENSPEVTKVLRDTEDVGAQLVSFVKLTTTQKATEPNPAAVQPSAGGETVDQSADAIAEQLNVLYQDPIGNKEQIKALVAELDKVVEKQ